MFPYWLAPQPASPTPSTRKVTTILQKTERIEDWL
jgi:hypothetical protein